MNWSAILFVIAMVESGANSNVKDGDGGLAVGMYQIHQSYVDDVNRVYGTEYTHEDMRTRSKAEDVVIKYLTYWGSRYQLNTGKVPMAEDYFRLHNGGCHFWKKKHKTDGYVKKCQKIIERYNLKI